MDFNIANYSKMLNEILDIYTFDESMKKISQCIKNDIPYQSLGVFLKIPNMDIYRFKCGDNISASYSKSSIFTEGDPLVQELTNLKPIDMRFPGQYMFEHEYSHLLISPLVYRKRLKGFIFIDKLEGSFGLESKILPYIILRTGFMYQNDFRDLDYVQDNSLFWCDQNSYEQNFATAGASVKWRKTTWDLAVMHSGFASDLSQTYVKLGLTLDLEQQ